MNRYSKKPVVIEAIQWDGENTSDILNWVGSQAYFHDSLYIETLEGTHKASPGDFIIKGVKGEFYLCKPDIFKLTYEKVDDEYDKEELIEEYSHIRKKIMGIEFLKVGNKTVISLITLSNGFEVVGSSACVNLEDFKLEIGEYYALKNALDKIEELEGYLMQEEQYKNR